MLKKLRIALRENPDMTFVEAVRRFKVSSAVFVAERQKIRPKATKIGYCPCCGFNLEKLRAIEDLL